MTVITAADIEKARGALVIAVRDIVTPLAADRAKELGVKIERSAQASPKASSPMSSGSAAKPVRAAPAAKVQEPFAPKGLPATQSGALYRRGASISPALQPDREAVVSAADPRPIAAVIGAGHVGAMTALRLAETSLFAQVGLVDIVPGLAAGLALDMWHSASLRGFTTSDRRRRGPVRDCRGGLHRRHCWAPTSTGHEPHGSHRGECGDHLGNRRGHSPIRPFRRRRRGDQSARRNDAYRGENDGLSTATRCRDGRRAGQRQVPVAHRLDRCGAAAGREGDRARQPWS